MTILKMRHGGWLPSIPSEYEIWATAQMSGTIFNVITAAEKSFVLTGF